MRDFETVPVGTMDRLKTAEDERDALAAHVGRMQSLGSLLVRNIDEGGSAEDFYDLIEKWITAVDQSPDTSLARLIYKKQRTAYLAGWMASGEGSNGEYPGDEHESPRWIESREEWIRRQAEEARP